MKKTTFIENDNLPINPESVFKKPI